MRSTRWVIAVTLGLLMCSARPALAQDESSPVTLASTDEMALAPPSRGRVWRAVTATYWIASAAQVSSIVAEQHTFRKYPGYRRIQPLSDAITFDLFVGGAAWLFWHVTDDLARDHLVTRDDGTTAIKRGQPKTALVVRSALIALAAWETRINYRKVQKY